MRHDTRSRLALVVGLVLAAGAADTAIAADSMPFLTEAYFSGPCPEGWGYLDGAKGRFLVPSPLGAGSGAFAGAALDGINPPTHTYSKIIGSIYLPSKEFILIDGRCNNNLGDANNYPIFGNTEPVKDNLPYIQYSACIKSAQPDQTAVPAGVLTYSALPTCPAGWTEETAVRGRYIIGLPDNGTPYFSFGGDPLAPSEVRTNSLPVNGNISFGGHAIAGGSGCCASGYAASGSFAINGGRTDPNPDDAHPYDSAVQAPYYTGTMCRKN
ncbi:MAG TPA: hypothetical protein VLX44_20205 [Xanthobacteraceae bacterium]|nr:hypothetical protein [Xanthobacteraceae bacterium]